MKSTFRNAIKYLFFIFITIYVFFAVFDFSLRIFKYFIYDDIKKLYDVKKGNALFRRDNYLGHSLNPNYKNSTDGILINSLGIRDDEVRKQKSNSVTRIIILGDSIAFGSDVTNSDSWPNRLEYLLNNASGHNRFEVINAGVIGYTSIQTKRFFESKLIELSPDMVIVSIGWNDLVFATYRKWYPEISIHQGPREKFKRRLNNFMFVKLFNELFLRTKSLLEKDQTQKNLLDEKALLSFKHNLEEIIRIAKSKNIRVVLTTLPTLLHNNMKEEEKLRAIHKYFKTVDNLMMAVTKFNDIIRKTAFHNNVDILESQFSSFDNLDKDRYFIDYCHFNKYGNEKFALEVYQKLFN